MASPPATIAVVTQARKNGLSTQFYNLAAQASQTVVQGLGDALGFELGDHGFDVFSVVGVGHQQGVCGVNDQ